MTQQTVLLTGASGFLAGHILIRLLKEGYVVKGSVRNTAKGDQIRRVMERQGANTENLSFVALDLTNDAGWEDAMHGVDYLIHTASPFHTSMPKDPDEMVKPALDGTRRALNAALKAKVKRIVLTSSMVAVCHGHEKNRAAPYTENDWTNINGGDANPYIISKTLAEKEAWKIMEAAGRKADLTVVNPGFILGPLMDDDIGTSGAIIKRLMDRDIPGCPQITFSHVDVRDVAELHILAMHDEAGFGHRVIAANGPVEFVEMAHILVQAFPDFAKKIPNRRLPNFLVRLIALFDKDVKTAAQSLGYIHHMNKNLAEQILGRPLIPTEEAVRQTGQSLIDMKQVSV